MANLYVAVLLAMAFATPTMAYPQFWAEEYNGGNCFAIPTKRMGCHKAPQPDASTSITVLQAGKPVTQVCAGKSYTVQVTFPNARLAYLTMSAGRMATINKLNQKCTNTFAFTPAAGSKPSTKFTTTATAPAASTWVMSVASATGECAPFQTARASVLVAKC